MGKPYSVDLRKRIIGFVEGGRSRRDAADHFEVSASCAIKLMDRWNQTGSAAPGRRGGSIGKLTPHKDFLLARVKEKADITMPELAAVLKAETSTEAAPASLSRFLIRHRQRFKKNIAGKRTKSPRRRGKAGAIEWIRLRQPRMCLEPLSPGLYRRDRHNNEDDAATRACTSRRASEDACALRPLAHPDFCWRS